MSELLLGLPGSINAACSSALLKLSDCYQGFMACSLSLVPPPVGLVGVIDLHASDVVVPSELFRRSRAIRSCFGRSRAIRSCRAVVPSGVVSCSRALRSYCSGVVVPSGVVPGGRAIRSCFGRSRAIRSYFVWSQELVVPQSCFGRSQPGVVRVVVPELFPGVVVPSGVVPGVVVPSGPGLVVEPPGAG